VHELLVGVDFGGAAGHEEAVARDPGEDHAGVGLGPGLAGRGLLGVGLAAEAHGQGAEKQDAQGRGEDHSGSVSEASLAAPVARGETVKLRTCSRG